MPISMSDCGTCVKTHLGVVLYLTGYLGRYVQGEYIFQPGHFQCSSKWFYHLIFHPRLQDPAGNSSNSLGRKIIRGVLNRFGVKNRRDMFVYKEKSSGNVFYLRYLHNSPMLL